MKKYVINLAILSLLVLPFLVFGQFDQTMGLIEAGGLIVKTLTRIAAGLALLVFIWGIVKYIFAQGNEGSKADGKKIMLGGIIGLLVIFAIWGILGFIAGDVGVLPSGGSVPPPEVDF